MYALLIIFKADFHLDASEDVTINGYSSSGSIRASPQIASSQTSERLDSGVGLQLASPWTQAGTIAFDVGSSGLLDGLSESPNMAAELFGSLECIGREGFFSYRPSSGSESNLAESLTTSPSIRLLDPLELATWKQTTVALTTLASHRQTTGEHSFEPIAEEDEAAVDATLAEHASAVRSTLRDLESLVCHSVLDLSFLPFTLEDPELLT
ncbi:unnamed protein product [Protopolystoma xenopodis]|uniref:Uncharacterized protein n=1 Tax=Protopolystoma xenopodis TaxID=117903 RepID=A0A3S5AAI8_9PLAT|nr:unnamed protein product [Protopolystoma xenopodis]